MPPGSEFAAFTSVFRAADPHRVKRNRQAVSCIACQRRKSKCDRQKPCGTCEKRGDGASCRFGTSVASGRTEVQVRLAKLEAMVRDLAAFGPKPPSGDSELYRLGLQENSLGSEGLGDGTMAMYHGQTSWAALVESIHDIQNALSEEDDLPPPEEPEPEKRPAPDIFLGEVAPITMNEVISSLPLRADADKLVKGYFNAKFIAVPFIHVHHFRRRYEAFWANPSSASFTWLSIMFSIFSIGAMIENVKGTLKPRQLPVPEPRYYMIRSAQCLVAGEYLAAKAFSVEGVMMFAHARNVQKQDSDSTIWSFYGLAVRLAQHRGYHLDADKVSPNITPFEVEMRRRTWFMVQSCDLLFSFQLGMPPMIYQDVCSVGHMRNLSDDDFDEDTKDLPPSRIPTDATPILCWFIKSRLCRLTRRVILHVLAVDTQPYEKTMSLHAELEEYYAQVPQCYRIRPIQSTSFTDEGYTVMHRLILELMYRKTLCVLHRPFLSVDRDEIKYNASREICRDASLRMVALHIELDREIQPGGRMYDDRFMVSSLTLHDFLVAAMIICLDLSESTDMSLQERKHRIHVLQQAYAIWKARSTKSKDAQHACKVLSAILNRVETPQAAHSMLSDGSTLVVGDSPDAAASDAYAPPDLTPMQITDYPGSFDEMLPIESFFGATEGFDWNSIDTYIRYGNASDRRPNPLFPDLMEEP